MRQARQPLEAIRKVEEKVGKIEEKVESPVERKRRGPSLAGGPPIRLGERVIVGTLRTEGVVTALGENDAEVQIGSVRLPRPPDRPQPPVGCAGGAACVAVYAEGGVDLHARALCGPFTRHGA